MFYAHYWTFMDRKHYHVLLEIKKKNVFAFNVLFSVSLAMEFKKYIFEKL